MEIFFDKILTRDGKQYKIEFGFDDKALAKDLDKGKFEVSASVRNLPANPNNTQGGWDKITIDVEIMWETQTIEFSHKGKKIGEVSLKIDLPDCKDDASDLDVPVEDSILEPHLAEMGIQAIPTDPFLGCLLKGALSTITGQLIRCYRQDKKMLLDEAKKTPLEKEMRREKPMEQSRVKRMYACLKKHGAGMLFTFLIRSGRCMVMLGWA